MDLDNPENFDFEANLCYILEDNEVLLIKKKRDHGKGLYNGPGGKIENNETPRESVVREVKEETCVTPLKLEKVAEIGFYFGENAFMYVHVYKTDQYSGEAHETDEARPKWFNIENIPYGEMWPDDSYWMPEMFDGKTFKSEFKLDEDGKEVLNYKLEEEKF